MNSIETYYRIAKLILANVSGETISRLDKKRAFSVYFILFDTRIQ